MEIADDGAATEAGLVEPAAITVDASGNVFFAELHWLRRIDGQTGIITTIMPIGGFFGDKGTGDGGPISNATLGLADALTTDSVGNLYIADTGLIRKINWKAGTIATIAGGGTSAMNGVPGVQFSLSRPGGLVFDGAGNLWIADAGSHRLFVVSAGLIQTVAGTSANGDGGPATNALLPDPSGIAVNAQNDLYISAGGSIRFVNHTTGLISVPAVISYLGPLPGSIAGAVQANIQIPTSIPAGASSLFMTGPTGRGNNYSSLAIPIYMQTALP